MLLTEIFSPKVLTYKFWESWISDTLVIHRLLSFLFTAVHSLLHVLLTGYTNKVTGILTHGPMGGMFGVG